MKKQKHKQFINFIQENIEKCQKKVKINENGSNDEGKGQKR
jgi:hypothetical protein